jgi:hypothetical protein
MLALMYHLSLLRTKHISSVYQERPTMLTRFGYQLWPERWAPTQHGAGGHVDAALGQGLHHAAGRSGWRSYQPTATRITSAGQR